MPRIAAILLAASLSACGMKGSLELPPGPPPEPLLGSKAAPQKHKQGSAPASADGSTDPNAKQ